MSLGANRLPARLVAVLASAGILCSLATRVLAEGGETIETATVIPSIPYQDYGNTCDNHNDYDEACPYGGSTAPDVVYAYTPPVPIIVEIDFCGMSYDTKVYVYAGYQGNLVACNDDACFDDEARLEGVALDPGICYYIVVDGYGTACGGYTMTVTGWSPCHLECPPGTPPEGEPPCADGYIDHFNGGCVDGVWYLVPLPPQKDGCGSVCGRVCSYHTPTGVPVVDRDTYGLFAAGGTVSLTVSGEFPVLVLLIYRAHCNDVGYVSAEAGPCQEATLSRSFDPGQPFWIQVTSSESQSVPDSQYYLRVCGLQESQVPVLPMTWGRIKGFYHR
jgi:hypothetical protein